MTNQLSDKPGQLNQSVTEFRRTGLSTSEFPFFDDSLVYAWRPVSKSFLRWVQSESQEIVKEWVDKLSVLSPSYKKSPRDELIGTVSGAFEANLEYIASGELDRMNAFIDYITEKRLEAGFSLSEVQKAFELFRLVVLERLRFQKRFSLLASSVESINACLSYTIHKFSDHFQRMHELSIRRYAKNLERDISIRTAELTASKHRYQTLVEGINDGYFVIRDQRIIFANRAFCSMHRAELEDVLGKPFMKFVTEEYREVLERAYFEILKGGTGPGPVQYMVPGEPRDNSHREVRARLADLGEGPVIIGICRDISERVSMESRVRENERLAYIGQLSASLSHEIRNPLSSIKLNLQILARRLDLDGYDQRRLEITVHEVTRLEEILRQLLDLARPMTINKSRSNLVTIAEGCVGLLEPKAQEKQANIIQRYPSKPIFVELDAAKIEQALINLLLNAIEASPNGGAITIWIRKSHTQTGNFIEIGVKDSGPGISQNQLRTLFTPFSTSKSHGSGLGLSNVKRIVEAHTGAIEVRSHRNSGVSFVIKLPIMEGTLISKC
ncbi:MAG: two-component system sensor histidine kinase NtrB [Desulfomonilaceae bacterium]